MRICKGNLNDYGNSFRGYRLYSRKLLLSVIWIFASISAIEAQNQSHPDDNQIRDFINRVQEIYGVDDELINGYPYYPPDRQISSHPYFENENWRYGTIYMNGEIYKDIPLKYDLTKDAIIIKATLKKDAVKMVHLNGLYVDSVKFDNHLLVHSRKFFGHDAGESYFEQVYLSEDDSVAYLMHFSKQYLAQYTNIAPRGRFSDTNEKRFLLIKGQQHEANSRRSFLKAFSQGQKRKVRSFMRKYAIKYNRASNKELNQLMEYCHDLLIN